MTSIASGKSEQLKNLAFASNDIGFKLFGKLDCGENVFFSPTSIFIALSMLHRGARGATSQEIRQTLSYDVAGLKEENIDENIRELLSSIMPSSDQYLLDISNALLSQVEFSVRDEYKEILKMHYNAILKEVDFLEDSASALDEINNWVSNKTHGKIQKLLDSLDQNAALVLLNAVYFKSAWEYEFSPEKTRNATFYNNGVTPSTVPMMNGREKVFYWEDKNSSALKLPYKGNKLSMVFILPNERDGLATLEEQLNTAKFEEIVSNMSNVFVTTDIPRFKLEYSKELKPILCSLGMKAVFSNEADLSGISERGDLKASNVVHKAYVEVNEEGSEAAGASGVEIVFYSSQVPRQYSFHADHPFLIFIRDEGTGMILFSGRVNKL